MWPWVQQSSEPVLLAHAGNIVIPGSEPANYTFSIDSDDGSLLYIDRELLVSHRGALLLPALALRCLSLLAPSTAACATLRFRPRAVIAAFTPAVTACLLRLLLRLYFLLSRLPHPAWCERCIICTSSPLPQLHPSPMAAGIHGFVAFGMGTVLLKPGSHFIEIDYTQVCCTNLTRVS